MLEEFCTYEHALALKELGFGERVSHYFENNVCRVYPIVTGWDFNRSFTTCASRPTKSQVFRWFIKEHGLWLRPDYYDQMRAYDYQGSIHELGRYSSIADLDNCKTVEELESHCIDKLIEIIKNK